MPAIEALCQILGINHNKFSKEENYILEIEFFAKVCQSLENFFKTEYKPYFQVMRFSKEMENTMFETQLVGCAVNDILKTNEYTLSGIAYYTQTPEDVVYEVASGQNTRPCVDFFRKIIEIHRLVRPHLYQDVMKKIVQEYLNKDATEEIKKEGG